MAQKTVAQKMGVTEGLRAHLRDAPASAVAAMSLPDLDLQETASGEFDHLHLFVLRQEEMRAQFAELRVDDVWSALKFTHPKAGKTYANSYGTLPGG